MTGRVLTVFIPGTPTPQGSKRHVGNGRLIEVSDVAPWRHVIAYTVRQAMTATDNPGYARGVAVQVSALFRVKRPATVKRDMPHVKPDLDKLLRALFDGLTDSGVIADDGQATDVHATKRYASDTERTGVILSVREAKP